MPIRSRMRSQLSPTLDSSASPAGGRQSFGSPRSSSSPACCCCCNRTSPASCRLGQSVEVVTGADGVIVRWRQMLPRCRGYRYCPCIYFRRRPFDRRRNQQQSVEHLHFLCRAAVSASETLSAFAETCILLAGDVHLTISWPP